MTTRRIVLIIGLVACFSTLVPFARRVWAQNAVEKRFDQLDRNGDGKITPDELPAAEFFKRLDLDGNGEITKPEAEDVHGAQGLRDITFGYTTPGSGYD